MPLSNWYAQAFRRVFQKTLTNVFRPRGVSTLRRRSRRPGQQISLESLEFRQMLSVNTVTTTADFGAGSLRQAILDANATSASDQIEFAASLFTNGVGTITLASALPAIAATSAAGSLTITGPGASLLTIDANQGNFSIFSINAGANLIIAGATVTGANLSGSGGAFNNSGTLSINSSTISGNSATNDAGGILNHGSGTLNIVNSTLSGNTAGAYGGGIFNSTRGIFTVFGGTVTVANSTLDNNIGRYGGGIFNRGTFTIANSTLSGNTATAYGGGINNYETLSITNCTFSGNSSQAGGGLQNNGALHIANTIIANSPIGGDYFGGGNIGTNLNNLVEDGTLNDNSSNSPGSGDISGDPLLGALQNNGGPTATMALGALSPAIAAGDATISNAAPIFGLDQRGYTRSSTTPSIGAYEYDGAIPAAPTITSVSPSAGSAAGGTSITITGTDLAGATAVTIGGTAVDFTVASSTSITTTTPAHNAGAVSIEVTTVGGTNTANTLYSYAPTVTVNTSNLANNATTLTITGTGFDPIAANNTVSFSSGTGTVTSATATALTVTFNTALDLGTLGAVVTTNGISSGDEVQVANIVNAPTITGISPAAGPTAGGTTITISGLDFINVTGVTIGGIAASSFTVVNGQKITAITPPGTRGAANVLVSTVDGTNSTTANTSFTYTAGSYLPPAGAFSPAFPHALSINAPGGSVSESASFTVTFNQSVTGVDAADFNLIATGTVANGTISSVTGSEAKYTVNVTGITGAGTLGLSLANLATISALPSFATQATFATGSKPASVTLGDVNGDGKLDMITANFNSANVSVLLGDGTGGFQGQQTFATGTQPFAVKLGDVNGDGSLDIITANKGSNNASVLLGKGDGTFAAQTTVATGTSPRSVALGDVNGDGTLDIITANQGSNNVSVLLGTGNGTFATQGTFGTQNAGGAYSVSLGDVNGDGKLDIVTANRSANGVNVLLGNGDGTFQASQFFPAGGNQFAVALGDLNGDGKLDIVTANTNTAVAVLIGNGNGTFKSQQMFDAGTNPRSLTLGDVNGDGRLDIMTANFGTTNASVLLGNGNGTFQAAATFATGTNSRSATLGDVNGDGRLDIVAANYNSDNASVLLGTGGSAPTAAFSPQQAFSTGSSTYLRAVTSGDVNGDGKLDIITTNRGSSGASVLVMLGNGSGAFGDPASFATGSGPYSVTLGDVNGDGRLDIVTANRSDSNVSVLLGNGNGTFQGQQTFTTGSSGLNPRGVALGDVNGDGRPDIVTGNYGSSSASVLLSNGDGTFAAASTFYTGANPRSVALGDVNGDGRLDIITANYYGNSASVLLGNGDGTFGTQASFGVGSYPQSVTVGDVNGDGNLDIIAANYGSSSKNVSVLLGEGDGTFAAQATFATDGSPYSVTLGDVNGDGRLDIVTVNLSRDTTSVLLGNGDGTFAAETAFATESHPRGVALGDVNGDGRLDIITANNKSDVSSVSVLVNSIAFTGQTATVVDVANTPAFGTPTATADGFTVQISNYNGAFTYGGTATAGGTVAISNTGLVTVSGVAANTSSTATITTTRAGYANGSAEVTATSLNPANRPTISPAATLKGGKVGTPYVMTYATLRAALKVANGVSIVIQTVQSGAVQKWSGTAWVTVSTAVNAPLAQRSVSVGDKIRWLPPAGVSGNRLAFKARAWDGSQYSAVTAQVTIKLGRVTWFR